MFESGLSSDATLLRLSNLAIAVGGRTLLSSLNLELTPGRLVAVCGPSGCGKSTLLRTINGLIDFPEGKVELQNHTPDQIGWPEYRRQVVLVEQQPVMLAGSVADNLERPFTFQHSTAQYTADQARQLLDRLGLGNVNLSETAQVLSIGQQQRVSLIRALMIGPKVVLLDEPTSALDSKASTRVEQLIIETAHQHGMAALIVTHAPDQAQRWCDDILDLTPFCTAALNLGAN